ncbi:4-hydroxy-tetrahydrodipicolinate reductase [Aliidiomarina iranensis]|uniref:4-hydroxy-tetrahydrodipicolinate reductase n=1 Tax=Aliidiomarina iranensis TaxID=1434071 RepID=A0A432VWX2_9GAMM|nr:4-hydroxy-tetrahydrodipicolinate reductase [Aliidiomarina iranensis]RUO21172.1 4-hydroxy-tetrahydrodipicolinate reductase [Aliidiomarina iranensis]
MKPKNLAIVGASGRMGRQVVAALADSQQFNLVAALGRENSEAEGIDSGVLAGIKANGVAVSGEFSCLQKADVVIDFALPESLPERLTWYQKLRVPAVICTTGFGQETAAKMQDAAKVIAILYAANTSVGINLLAALTENASRVLGMEADIEVLEAHHTKKQDAPSGTALLLGDAAARGRGQVLADVAAYDRNGKDEVHRTGSIGFASIRAGDIVGEHTVYLVVAGERIELTHRVAQRSTFAAGALRAAAWLAKPQKPGFYQMKDMLGLD